MNLKDAVIGATIISGLGFLAGIASSRFVTKDAPQRGPVQEVCETYRGWSRVYDTPNSGAGFVFDSLAKQERGGKQPRLALFRDSRYDPITKNELVEGERYCIGFIPSQDTTHLRGLEPVNGELIYYGPDTSRTNIFNVPAVPAVPEALDTARIDSTQ